MPSATACSRRFKPSSPTLAPKAGRRFAAEVLFDHSLTVLYRILFLLFAEARGLVPLWHPLYRDRYSLDTIVTALLTGRHSTRTVAGASGDFTPGPFRLRGRRIVGHRFQRAVVLAGQRRGVRSHARR